MISYIQTSATESLRNALGALQASVGVMNRRKAIENLESVMNEFPAIEQPLTHHWAEGLYAREIFNPKGCLIVTKIHKQPNFSFIMRGKLTVITEEGQMTLVAPKFFKTNAGTKRVLFSHEDTVFVTVHPNIDNCEELEVLENRIIANDMKEAV